MNAYIKIPYSCHIMQNPLDFGYCIAVNSMKDLDDIIEQCRDIKIRTLAESKGVRDERPLL